MSGEDGREGEGRGEKCRGVKRRGEDGCHFINLFSSVLFHGGKPFSCQKTRSVCILLSSPLLASSPLLLINVGQQRLIMYVGFRLPFLELWND